MNGLAAVTGGTGFLGRAVVSALARGGWRVRLLARRPPCGSRPPATEVEVVPGDLSDPEALRRLVRGAKVVVHAAGLIRAPSRASFLDVNAGGSARIAAAVATEAPRARLVHVSSMAAREPHLSDYAASKRLGEGEVGAAMGDGSFVIVRPSAIYGPGDAETLRVFRAARGPVVPLFHGSEARVCLIHVDDAAEAIVALAAGGASGQVFELSDDRRGGHPWRSVIEEAALAVGGSPRLVRVPRALVALTGSLVGAAGRLIGRSPILTTGKARELLHADWSSTPERQPPGELWAPRVRMPEGFADTVRWYRAERWL